MNATDTKRILTMNRGSATLKSALYEISECEQLIASIAVEKDGDSGERLKIRDSSGKQWLDTPVSIKDPDSAPQEMFGWLGEHGFLKELAAVGHRLVHGGPRYREPLRVTPRFLKEIEKLVPLDPDHLPAAIRGIKFVARKFPKLPQVACFDTAFHASLPIVAQMYALPRKFFEQGIHRYGFHGLSYEFIMSELRSLEPQLASSRVVIAHLGSGASIVAVRAGKSIDTSMGFTPLEGLVMATRSGDVDPGALLFLLENDKLFGHKKMSAKELNTLLNKKSGLLGVSGTSSDMKSLIEKMPSDARAAEAVDLFCYRVKKYIGAYAAALGGLDVLIFAGGIGERAPSVRARICEGLDFLGICLAGASNKSDAPLISAVESLVKLRVVKTNEDLMIARHVRSVLGWAYS